MKVCITHYGPYVTEAYMYFKILEDALLITTNPMSAKTSIFRKKLLNYNRTLTGD